MTCFSYLLCMAVLMFSFFSKLEGQTLTIKSTPSGPTYVKLGENLTLDVTYTYTGIKGVNVEWSKNNSALVRKFDDGSMFSFDKRASVKGEASLVLTNIERNDNGTFTVALTADDVSSASISRNVIVFVQMQPTAVINCSTNNTIKEGDDFNCLCNSTGGNPPPTASWYKDGEMVSGPGYSKTLLSLKNINESDTGNYSCIVQSHDLNYTKSVEIQVQYKPKITSFNSDQKNNISLVGKNVTITCVADAFPAPNYIIFHNGMKLTDVVDGVKAIQSANLSDDGRYECVANNSFGRVSARFNLTVNVQPFAITNCSTSLKVKKDDDVVCLCNSKGGNPSPTALWYKNGIVVNGAGYSKNLLFLKNISKSDSGTSYSCVVKSLSLSNAIQVVIQVHYEPWDISFKSDEENNIVSVGKTVKIICSATAFPAPDYIIFYNGLKLVDVVDGVKTIQSANLSDDGQYKCVANNSVGHVSASFNLTVNVPAKDAGGSDKLPVGAIVGIVISVVVAFLISLVVLLVLLIRYRSKRRDESEAALRGRSSSHGSSANVSDEGNPYESVDKVKVKPTEEAGTSDLPSIPPLYAVVDKVARQKEREAKPVPLTYASLDPVPLQPDSSKMRDRSHEETNYATIDMEKLHSAKI